MLKFYYFPVSAASTPVLWLLEYHNIPHEKVVIDLTTGGNYAESYGKVNPANLVPAIDDDGFILTESKAILKYLCLKHKLDWYPEGYKEQAVVDQALFFVASNFSQAFAHRFVLPQLMNDVYGYEELTLKQIIDEGRVDGNRFMKVLNDVYLKEGRSFLAGDNMSVADAYLSSILAIGHVVKLDYKEYPNILTWLERVQSMDKWHESFGGIYMFKDMMKDNEFASFSL